MHNGHSSHPDRQKSFIMIWMTRSERASETMRTQFSRAGDKLTDYLYQILPRGLGGGRSSSRIISPDVRARFLVKVKNLRQPKCKKRTSPNSESIQVCIFSALLLKYLPNVYSRKIFEGENMIFGEKNFRERERENKKKRFLIM